MTKLLILGVIILLLAGCASVSQDYRKMWTNILDQQIQTVQMQEARVGDLCEVGQFDAGYVEGTGTINPDDISGGMKKRMARLEELCKKPAEQLTAKEKGEISALGLRLWIDRLSLVAGKTILPLIMQGGTQ